MDVDKKLLENELNKFQGMDKERRLMNQRIVDLEDQLKKLGDVNNGLSYKQVASEEQLGRLKNQLSQKDRKFEELKNRLRDIEKQKERH